MQSSVVRRLILLGIVLTFPAAVFAQEATLTGTITDSTGGVLPGVSVVAVNEASGNQFESVTDARGIYRIPARVGTYRITATLTGTPVSVAASISVLMYLTATQACSPQEVRQRLIESRICSGRSPQNAQLTSITSNAGRLPNPARAPNPPAANTALSRSVRNLSQIRSFIEIPPQFVIACVRAFCSTMARILAASEYPYDICPY